MNSINKTFKKTKDFLGKKYTQILGGIKLGFYNLSVLIHNLFHGNRPKKTKSLKKAKWGEISLLLLLLTVPITIFLVAYVYVNFSSILMSFQVYDQVNFKFNFVGLDNIKRVSKEIIADPVVSPIFGRSMIAWAIQILIGFPLNIIFAYVIYKKVPLAGFFQVVLFLPSILSSMVITLMFKNFVVYIVPKLLEPFNITVPPNLLTDFTTGFAMQNFYVIWAGFGTQLILYSGAMSRIPDSLIEVGKLEGITMMKEFWYIIIPMVWQTITIFLVTSVAGIFTSQLGLFNFFGVEAPTEFQTIGYYLFQTVVGEQSTLADYPYAAAGGLIFTLIAAPITLLARWALEKFGPNVEF